MAMTHPLPSGFQFHERHGSLHIRFSLKPFACMTAFCLTAVDIPNYWNQGSLPGRLCSASIVSYMKIWKPPKHPITLLKRCYSCGLHKYSHLNISLKIHSFPNAPFLTYPSKAKWKRPAFTCPPGSLSHCALSISHHITYKQAVQIWGRASWLK